jgi:predicted esterase
MIKNQKTFYVCLLLLSFLSSSKVFSQVILPFKTTPKSVIGYVEYLPPDYSSNTKKYPIVIFLHGQGESGPASDDPAVLATGYNSLVFYGPPKYVKMGTKFPFLLVCPQLKKSYGNWPSWYVMEVIEHVKTYLRVDPNRIYLTGTSLGGGGAWIAAQDYPDYFACVAPVAGSTNSTSKACPMAKSSLPVWAFHGDKDGVVPLTTSSRMVNAINACGANPAAKLTIYPGLGHNAYAPAYDPSHTIHNPNLYDWMMTQVNNGGTIAANKAPIANAGADKTITLPTSSLTFYGTGADTDGTVIDYSWVKVSGGVGSLKNTKTPNLLVYALEAGTYVFRLTVTDNLGGWHSDDVKLVVNGTSSTTTNVLPVANAGADQTITLPTNTLILTGTGSDSDGSISSYQWTKVSGGSVTLSGAATTKLSLSALLAGTYVFRLTVKDDKLATSSDDITVTVKAATATNAAPVANAGVDKTITLPTNSILLAGSGSDTDGKIASYQWTKVSGSTATLTNATTSALSLSNLVAGSYVFRLTVTDDKAAKASDDVTVTVKAATTTTTKLAPDAYAGPSRTIKLPVASVVLNGSATTSTGTITSYKWEQVAGTLVTLTNATTANLTLSNIKTAGSRTFKLTVKNSANYSDYSLVKIIFE